MPVIRVRNRAEDGTPIFGEEEKLHYQDEASWFDTDKKAVGEGVLYVTNKNVIWLDSKDTGSGFSVDYQSLTMHAVGSDSSLFEDADKYLYCQIGYEGEDFYLVTKDDVANAYDAICQCSAMNPDPEDEGGNELFFGGNRMIQENVGEAVTTSNINGGSNGMNGFSSIEQKLSGLGLNNNVNNRSGQEDDNEEEHADGEGSKNAHNAKE
mmetsp:Transcript_6847/g.9452  ORF Transcript_6847/g.9452 Transcript_6847/m.9452 type:complete len:209 (-) Transcript_6847:192-818(-)